jgi:flavin-binding protein dodecin
MSVARVVEISSTSDKSFEDAIQQCVTRASKTLREIRSAWVKEQEVQIEGNRIATVRYCRDGRSLRISAVVVPSG